MKPGFISKSSNLIPAKQLTERTSVAIHPGSAERSRFADGNFATKALVAQAEAMSLI